MNEDTAKALQVDPRALMHPKPSDLKDFAGSEHADFNMLLLNQVNRALWVPAGTSEAARGDGLRAALVSVHAFKPKDEVEDMIADSGACRPSIPI